MSGNQSAIVTSLEVDAPLVQDANYRFNENDRQYIDNQIRGVQQHLVDALIRGQHATYVRTSPNGADFSPGDVVCLAAQGAESEVVWAVSESLANAGAAFGVIVLATPAGANALIAIGGVLPPSVTGLEPGSSGSVRVNPSTGRCEYVDSLSAGDYGIGFLASSGHLLVAPGGRRGDSDVSVDDDIAVSAGSTIDRVRGLRGVPIAGADGAPSLIGAVPTYNAQGGDSYKLKKPTPPGWFDVTDYGAVGDGSHDDTAAINAAITAATAAGGVVYFPPGTYKVTSELTMPGAYVKLLGPSHGRSAKIQSYVLDTLLYLAKNNASQLAVYIEIENLTFECMVDQSATPGWLASTASSQTIAVNASARTFTRSSGSFLTDGFQVGQRVKPAGFSTDANNYGRVIQSVTATVITVTDGTGLVNESGTGDESISSPFEVAAGAAIEARGGGVISINNCVIDGFPIGICLDGTLQTKIHNFVIRVAGSGYQGWATNGKGIFLVDGPARGRGFTINLATNCNAIDHGFISGYQQNIEVNGGVSNTINDVVILCEAGISGLTALSLLGTFNLKVTLLECEGFNGTSSSGIRVSGACYACDFHGNTISAEVPIRIVSGGIYTSVISSNSLIAQGAGTVAINAWGGDAFGFNSCWSNWASGGCTEFINIETASGVSFNRVGDTFPGGLGVNKQQIAQAILHARIYDYAKPTFQIDDALGTLLRQSIPSPQQHKVDYVHRTAGNTPGGGAFGRADTVQMASGSGHHDVVKWTPTAGVACMGTLEFKVQQQRSDDETKRGVWSGSRVFRVTTGGAITIETPATLDDADNNGSFTDPTIEDDGSGNIVVRVYEHGSQSSSATAVANLVVTVKT